MLLPSAPALAQDSAANDGSEIIVSARRTDERLQDIPLAVTAISGNDLDRQSITEIRQLSSTSPSLNVKEHSNNPQGMLVSLRGQTQAGILLTTDSSVGVYVDGVNVARSNGLRSALVDLARVEVLRGPQGTLYGRNTTGGAVSIITNSPTDRLEGSVKVGFGNYDAANVVGILNVPLSPQVATRFVVQKSTHDGYGHDGLGKPAGDEDSLYLRGKIRGDWGNFRATLSGDYGEIKQGGGAYFISGINPGYSLAVNQVAAEMGLPLLPSTSPAYLVGAPATPEALQQARDAFVTYTNGTGNHFENQGTSPNFAKYKGWSASLDMELDLNDSLKLRSISGFRHYLRRNDTDYDSTPFWITNGSFKSKADFFSQELQLLGKMGRADFVVGAYYSYENGYESGASITAPLVLADPLAFPNGDVTNKNVSIFGQLNYKITDSLTFTGGARYSKENKKLVSFNETVSGCSIPIELLDAPGQCRGTFHKKDSDPSWLASLDYKFNRNFMVYAKFAKGFRAGGHNMRGARSVQSFAPFDPETITEYEIGTKVSIFDRALQLNIAAYHDDYKDVQRTITTLIPGGGTTTTVSNAAQSTIKGIDFEATLRPIRALTLSAVVGYVDAKYDYFVDATGDRTNEDWPTPKWSYAFSARYDVESALGLLSLQADYQGQGRQNLYPGGARPEETTQKAYGLLNGRISLDIDDARYQIAIFGRNILDKEYASGAQAFDKSLGYNIKYLGAPRTYGVELKTNF
ncbi:TonB-dependent receptor [Tsuneonella sp. CC-YZS046]|uniref:TonB-dependent receptor n=1 Tax=Tsuneonella sp. CC-YZS046 TaxID=3042152 RepID=UPI002D77B792|nr:TonB-dependent receptor [Tsuneonella sp. CC-YZS046]WRO66664.1 TonB-dependent receptor [Tsuneonella sp. CC-YZS046]